MTQLIRWLRGNVVALIALAVALGSTGYAASLQLGSMNRVAGTTTLANTDTGPALDLRVKPGSPPMSVNSSAIVPRLNAGYLGGVRAKDFARVSSTYTRTQADGRFPIILLDEVVEGSDSPFSGSVTLYEETIQLPGPGMLMAFLAGDIDRAGVVDFAANGDFQQESHINFGHMNMTATSLVRAPNDQAAFSVTLTGQDTIPTTVNARLVVLFVPS